MNKLGKVIAYSKDHNGECTAVVAMGTMSIVELSSKVSQGDVVYSSPRSQEWVELSKEQISEVRESMLTDGCLDTVEFATAISNKLRQLNAPTARHNLRCSNLDARIARFNGTLHTSDKSPIPYGVEVDVLYESGATSRGSNFTLRWEQEKDGFYPSHHGCIVAWKPAPIDTTE